VISEDSMHALVERAYTCGQEFLQAQCARYTEAVRVFEETFGQGPVAIYRAPGRVNLIGEHTDYNQGYVMPTAIDRDVVIVGRPRPDATVHVCNVEGKYPPFTFDISRDIASEPVGHWSNYVRGAAQRLAQFAGRPLHGMDIVVAGRPPYGTPIGVGLSSSTSLTVVATLALAHTNQLMIDGQELAQLASEAEWYVGTRGGIMDQFASILGRGGHALFLDCRPIAQGRYRLECIPLPQGYRLVVCNTVIRHENTRSEFNTRVFECRVGAYMIRQQFPQVGFLRDVAPDTLGLTRAEVEALLQEVLPEGISGRELVDRGVVEAVAADMPASFSIELNRTYRVQQRCRHVISENQRVLDSVEALRAGDMGRFGSLMEQAHASARDDYEVSVPEVEAMVEAAHESPGCLGARLTGAGWGGCVVCLVEEDTVGEFVASVHEKYMLATGIDSEIIVCNSARGAQVVGSDLRL